MPAIHPTALIEKGAEIGKNVAIGPYCVVSGKAVLHDGVELRSHVVIAHSVEIGENSVVHSFASLGAPGQIYRGAGEVGRLVIGVRCEIREHVTMSCGSPRENMITRIGDDCMFMVGSHVAHDCTIGNQAIFANNATLGGHVKIGDHVFMGGLTAVHQFCAIGEHAIVGGMTGVSGHVIPFGHVTGDRATLKGLNLVGLERRGFSKEAIHTLNHAFQTLFYGDGIFADRLEMVARDFSGSAEAVRMVDFIRHADKRRPLTLATADHAA